MPEYHAGDKSGAVQIMLGWLEKGNHVSGVLSCHQDAEVVTVYKPDCPLFRCPECGREVIYHGGGCQGGEACARLGKVEK